MARILKQLIRKPSLLFPNKSIATWSHHTQPNNLPPLPFLPTTNTNQSILLNHLGGAHKGLGSNDEEEVGLMSTQLGIYPSFSVGYFLNPDLGNGLGLDGVVGTETEQQKGGMMWADSVKKKRKKKMNKHKYKKLRKRLRRKTKT